MRTDVSVTHERLIAADPDVVWQLLADPAARERLDPGTRLESRAGAVGEVGSSYVLEVRAGASGAVRLQHEVADAEPGVRLVTRVTLRGQRYGEQRADLVADPAGTLLRWTTVLAVGPVAVRAATDALRRRLDAWLDAVERDAGVG